MVDVLGWSQTEHAGQATITLTGLHAHFGKAREALKRASTLLKQWVTCTAEQFNATTVWTLCCDHIKQTIARIGPPQTHRFLANNANGIG